MQGKGNPYSLLMGSQTCAVTMEINVYIWQKLEVNLSFDTDILQHFVYDQRIPHPNAQIFAQAYSMLLYSQGLGNRNLLNIHNHEVDDECGTYTLWNTVQL